MCGIFVLACSNLSDTSDGKRHSNIAAHFLFQAGRLIALTLLGAITGAIGSLGGFRAHIPGAEGIVAIGAGFVLAIFSLGQIGIAPSLRIPEPNVMQMFGGRIR